MARPLLGWPYSFNFGEAGKSVSTATETIGFADGEKQIFNYTVKNKPVLGEIKISGGGYSWTEAGSSDATKFTATANKNSGAISAIYLTGAPEAGQQVSISYDHNSDGVMGALSRGGQAWLELTVDGEALSPRERMVAVPFALRAGVAENSLRKSERLLVNFPNITLSSQGWMKSGGGRYGVWFPNTTTTKIDIYVPKDAKKLILRFKDGSMNYSSRSDYVRVIPGIPKVFAQLINPDLEDNPVAIFSRIGKNEFHIDDPQSGWLQVAFEVMPLSDYSYQHYFLSKNSLVILVK